MNTMSSTDTFLEQRELLFSIVYNVLGSVADTEDVLQETWLAWSGRTDVQNPRAYLVRVAVNAALARRASINRRKEEYVGPWLPEPVLTPIDPVERTEAVSLAMLVVLETLTPLERAVFVLHEVFEVPFDEIAEAVGKSSPAVRQIAHRARRHVAARSPRMQVSRTEQQHVVDRFLAALTTGDVQGLMDVLAPDVVLVSDGGGLARAARHPVEGVERVAAFLSGFSKFAPDAAVATLLLNGAVAARIDPDGDVTTAVTFVVEDGRITRIYAIRNPHKTGRLDEVAELRR
jgi:RNA polymerase sigma-70 factor (ECF subfamily)